MVQLQAASRVADNICQRDLPTLQVLSSSAGGAQQLNQGII